MKKTVIAIFALAWVFAGCNKIDSSKDQQSENKPRRVVFDIEVVDDGVETKAVKRRWNDGDRIQVILPCGDEPLAPFELVYTNSEWNLYKEWSGDDYDLTYRVPSKGGIISAMWAANNDYSEVFPKKFNYTMDNLEAENDTFTITSGYNSDDEDVYKFKITAKIHMKQPSNSLKVTVTGCPEGTPVMYVGGDVNNELKYSYDSSKKKVKRTWVSDSRNGIQGKKEADGEYSFFVNPTADNLTLMIGNKCYTREIADIEQYAGNAIKTNLAKWTEASYVDENGATQGDGTAILQLVDHEYKTVIWAPVNLGYSENYPYGKLYQWGRIAGQGYTNHGESTDEAGVSVNIMAPESYPLIAPDANTFYKTSSDSSDDWYAQSYEDQIKTDWNSIEKNEFIGNPCPEGWRVPTHYELEGLFKNNTVKNADGIDGKGASEYPWDNQKVFLPFAGYKNRYNGDGQDRGVTFHYWTSDIYHLDSWNEGLVFEYNPTWDNKLSSVYVPRSEAASIRCVKE